MWLVSSRWVTYMQQQKTSNDVRHGGAWGVWLIQMCIYYRYQKCSWYIPLFGCLPIVWQLFWWGNIRATVARCVNELCLYSARLDRINIAMDNLHTMQNDTRVDPCVICTNATTYGVLTLFVNKNCLVICLRSPSFVVCIFVGALMNATIILPHHH